jgi:hypothetical protein
MIQIDAIAFGERIWGWMDVFSFRGIVFYPASCTL